MKAPPEKSRLGDEALEGRTLPSLRQSDRLIIRLNAIDHEDLFSSIDPVYYSWIYIKKPTVAKVSEKPRVEFLKRAELPNTGVAPESKSVSPFLWDFRCMELPDKRWNREKCVWEEMNMAYLIIESYKPWNSPELLVNVNPARLNPDSSYSTARLESKPQKIDLIVKESRFFISELDESSVFDGEQNVSSNANVVRGRLSPRTRRMNLPVAASSTATESNSLHQGSTNVGEVDVNAISNPMSMITLPADSSSTTPPATEPLPVVEDDDVHANLNAMDMSTLLADPPSTTNPATESLSHDIVPIVNVDNNEESTVSDDMVLDATVSDDMVLDTPDPRPAPRRGGLAFMYDDRGRKLYMPRNRATNSSVLPSRDRLAWTDPHPNNGKDFMDEDSGMDEGRPTRQDDIKRRR